MSYNTYDTQDFIIYGALLPSLLSSAMKLPTSRGFEPGEEPRNAAAVVIKHESDGPGDADRKHGKLLMEESAASDEREYVLAILDDPETKYWLRKPSKSPLDCTARKPSIVPYLEEAEDTTPNTINLDRVDDLNSNLPSVNLERQRRTAQRNTIPGAVRVAGISTAADHSANRSSDTAWGNGDDPRQSHLAVASPVTADEEMDLPQATNIVNSSAAQQRKKATRVMIRNILSGVLIVALVLTGIIAPVSVYLRKKNRLSPTNASDLDGTPLAGDEGFATMEEYILSLLPAASFEVIMVDPMSPQGLAFEWLMADVPYLVGNATSDVEEPFSSFWPLEGPMPGPTVARIRQRFALAALYFSTGGEKWLFQASWLNHTMDECHWEHSPHFHLLPVFQELYARWLDDFLDISKPMPPPCDEKGVYQHLWLDSNNLDGVLPNELYMLTSLKTFSSPFNFLRGTVATQVGLLTNMEGIAILNTGTVGENTNKSITAHHDHGFNSIYGTIPSQIGLLTNLEVFSFMNLDHTGIVPHEFWSLTKMQYVSHLFSPKLRGTLPTEIGLMTELRFFSRFACDFSGTVPSELGLLTENLIWFGASGDFYTHKGRTEGTIPTELGMLTALEGLALGDTTITGPIPSELGLLEDPLRLNFYNTLMTGTIPTQLANPQYRDNLRVNNNLFSGTVPSEFGQLTKVGDLCMQGNLLTGKIPSELGQCANMRWLRLQNNQLTGTIPSQLGKLNSLMHTMEIQGNPGLMGTIPSMLCNLTAKCVVMHGDRFPYCADASHGVMFECTKSLCGCECECGN